MPKQPCVYILASQTRGTLYIGVTAHLLERMYQHRTGVGGRFTSRYRIYRLVRYEFFADMPTAIARETQLKNWHRPWKINQIEGDNPHWHDLGPGIGLESLPPR